MKNLIFLLFALVGLNNIFAQQPSAIADFESTSEGILIPRMTTQQKNDISTPVRSLLVYDLDTKSYWYYEDNEWKEIASTLATGQEKSNTSTQFFEYELLDDLQLDIPGTIDEETQITVCIDITHTEVGYLEIGIIHDGTVIPLSYSNGGNADNFTQTCFSNVATTPISSIIESDAPFTGQYQPDGSFSDLLGSNIAGTWTLFIYVTDEFAWNGYLNSWSIIVDSGEPTYASVLADGNRDTKIQVEESPNENQIRFDIAGQEKMIIDQNGQVGIGTSTPGAPLTIKHPSRPAVEIQLGNLASGLEQTVYGGSLYIKNSFGQNGIEFNTFGNSFISGGSFGIGTNQPLERFHLRSSRPYILLTPSPDNSFPGTSQIFLAEDEEGKTGMRWQYNGLVGKLELRSFTNVDRVNQDLGGYGLRILNIDRETGKTDLKGYNIDGPVMTIENSSNSVVSDGLEIKLGVRPTLLNNENNFITFSDSVGPVGRIEGKLYTSFLSRQMVNNLLGQNPNVPNPVSGLGFDASPYGDTSRDQSPPDFYAASQNDQEFEALLDSEFGMQILDYTVDFVGAIVVFATNVIGAIGGLAVFGDIDDIVWSGWNVLVCGLKLDAYVAYEETVRGIAFESGGADYAEWLRHAYEDETFLAGEIVGVKGGLISKRFADPDQFMVISTNPIVIGNMPDTLKHWSQVAFIGQTPVRIIGDVHVGDYILPSGSQDGFALALPREQMKTADYERIVGVSWSDGDSNKIINLANVAVGINSNDLAETVGEMQMQINRMQRALHQLSPDFALSLYPEDGDRLQVQDQTISNISLSQKVNTTFGVEEIYHKDLKTAFQDLKEGLASQMDLSSIPYLEGFLENPTPENAQIILDHYEGAMARCRNLLASR